MKKFQLKTRKFNKISVAAFTFLSLTLMCSILSDASGAGRSPFAGKREYDCTPVKKVQEVIHKECDAQRADGDLGPRTGAAPLACQRKATTIMALKASCEKDGCKKEHETYLKLKRECDAQRVDGGLGPNTGAAPRECAEKVIKAKANRDFCTPDNCEWESSSDGVNDILSCHKIRKFLNVTGTKSVKPLRSLPPSVVDAAE